MSRRGNVLGAVLMTILGAAGAWMLWRYPTTAWRCERANGRVDCLVTDTLYAAVAIGHVELADIRATEVYRQESNRYNLWRGRRRPPLGAYSMRVTTASGLVHLPSRVSRGPSSTYSDISDGIRRLQQGQGNNYVAWQFDWLPMLLGTVFAGLGPLILLLLVLRRVMDRRQAAARGRQAAQREFFSRRRG
jgi:hypothetical protein